MIAVAIRLAGRTGNESGAALIHSPISHEAVDEVGVDLDQLFGDQAMGMFMDASGRVGVGRLDQAKQLAAVLVEPIFEVIDVILPLDFHVSPMGVGDILPRRIRVDRMDIHVQWHGTRPLVGRRHT